MIDDMERLRQRKQQGYFCSQIILLEGLELLGKDNPDLVRAVHPLAGGLGFSGELCGALSGAACLLGLYAGKGAPGDMADERLNLMVVELVEWFKQTYIPRFGGIRCQEILQDNSAFQSARCPELVLSSLQKAKELLVENGYDLSGIEL